MPTYQYACTACDHQLEAVQSFSDDPLTQCPICQGRLRKLFGSVGIVFKGPGFYRTDSRGGSNGRAGSGEAQAGGAAEKGSADEGPGAGSGTRTPGEGSADRSPAESSGAKPAGSGSAGGAPAAAGSTNSGSRSTGG